MWQCLYENHRELPIKELNNVRCVKGIMKFNLTKLLCVFHTLNQHKQLKQLWGYCFGFVSIRIPPIPQRAVKQALSFKAYFEDPGILSFRICGLSPCTQETQNTTC